MTEAEYTLKIDRRANMSHDPAIWIDAVEWSRKNPPPEVLALVEALKPFANTAKKREIKRNTGEWRFSFTGDELVNAAEALAEFEKVIDGAGYMKPSGWYNFKRMKRYSPVTNSQFFYIGEL